MQYVDSVWADTAAHGRRNMAKVFMKTTIALLRREPTDYEPVAVRRALREHAFNKNKRDTAPPEMQAILRFVQRNSLSMAAWEDPAKVEEVIRQVNSLLNGKQAAASSIRRNRNALSGIFDYAIKRGVLAADPTPGGK
ncbi:hypothetical protein [Streptomyces tailanensis]|uniref:hypothetical protein n=1 Tax=Streptomyces tailanensis TaxID=2569858 RepID=UPI001C0F13A2|nr:hypothetical protein [Streptomyces tailanensis]